MDHTVLMSPPTSPHRSLSFCRADELDGARPGYLMMLQDHLPVHGPAWHVVDISRVDPPLRQGLGI